MKVSVFYLLSCILATLFVATQSASSIPKPTPLISGIVLDVEPYTLPEWETQTTQIAGQYIDLLENVRAAIDASPHDLTFAACIPAWFDTIALERNSVNKTLLEFVIDTVDRIVVMAYRDWASGARPVGGRTDSILEITKEELQLGKPNSVEIVVETLCVGDDLLSFCEENTTYLESQLSVLESSATQSPSYYGKGIHYYPPWASMTPQYSINDDDCSKKRSMFLWDDDVINDVTARTQMLNYAANHGVSSFMLSTYNVLRNGNSSHLTETLRDIYEKTRAPVEALFGNNDWASAQTFALGVVQDALDYIDATSKYGIPAVTPFCKEEKQDVQIPASITVDFAPYLDTNWETNSSALANEFLDNVQLVQSMAKSQNPDIVFTVACPFWYDTVSVTRNGTTRPLHELLIDSVDRILISPSRTWANGTKNGRLDSISSVLQEEFQYVASLNNNKKKIALLLNVYPDNPLITFNNETSTYLEGEITKLNQIYAKNPAYDGVLINSQTHWASMKPSYTVPRSRNSLKGMYTNSAADFVGYAANHAVTKIVMNADSFLISTKQWKTLKEFHQYVYANQLAIEWFWEQPDWAKVGNQQTMVKHMQLAIDWINQLAYPIPSYVWDGVSATVSTVDSNSGTTSTESSSNTNSVTTISTNSDDSNNVESPNSNGKSKSNTGAIVGGVVGGAGGLICCLIIVGIIVLSKRRNQSNSQNGKSFEHVASGVTDVEMGNTMMEEGATNYGMVPSRRAVERGDSRSGSSVSPPSSMGDHGALHSHQSSAHSLYGSTFHSANSVPGRSMVSGSLGGGSKVSLKSDWKIDYDTIQIEKEIGRGAYGIVFKAKWRATPVAVKRMITESMTQKDFEDFHNEVQLMKNLRPSPNVVILLGVCDQPLCIVTEFYERGSLHDLITSDKQITPEMMTKITIGIARGMLHLHMENIIHRDLAARNVLLGSDYEPKISDFGLSRVAESKDGGKTQSSVGPLLWMAPECINDAAYSRSSDVWAFGVTIIELYTRKRPYEETEFSALHIASSVMRDELKPTIPSNVPKPLVQILNQCFQFEASKRPDFATICAKLEKEL